MMLGWVILSYFVYLMSTFPSLKAMAVGRVHLGHNSSVYRWLNAIKDSPISEIWKLRRRCKDMHNTEKCTYYKNNFKEWIDIIPTEKGEFLSVLFSNERNDANQY